MIRELKARRKAAGEGGFTLIELLVVIIILGILAAVVVFAVGGIGDKGNSSACVIDTRTFRTALEANFANFNDYAPTGGTVADNQANATGAPLVDEALLVARGFLSEASQLHDARVYDANTGTGTVQQAFQILVQDGDAPGGDCGTAGGLVPGAGNL